ncbi:MAG: hypothetical protein RLY20_2254 [Verrucomicrobiota bacterium]|jgi:hypothetical protein
MQVFYYPPGRSKESIEASMRQAAKQRDEAVQKARAEELNRRNVEGEKARLAKKAAQYIGVEARHAWGGPAPAAVFEERMRLCLACPWRVDELEGMRDDGGVGFCTKCGCGANQRSKLSVKLTLAGVECPLGKFAKVEGTGGTIASAVEAAKGIAASAIDLVRKNLAADR